MSLMTPPEPPPSNSDHRAIAAVIHLLGLLTSVVGPLIAWGISRRSSRNAFLTHQAIESVNFQLTVVILYFLCKLLSFILIGFLLFPCVFIFQLFFSVLAAMRVSQGIAYHYPYVFALIRP